MKFLNPALKSLKTANGIAALPTMLLLGGIIVEIAIVGAFISYLYTQGSFGARASEEALSFAQSGIQDAIIRIIRDKGFFSLSPGYDIIIANKTANIIVCKESKSNISSDCSISNPGKSEITSLGSVLTKKRKLRAIVNVNSSTGEVKVESIGEIQL